MPQTIQGKKTDGTYGVFKITDDGSLSLSGGGGILKLPYDYIEVNYPTSSTEVYITRSGGASGSIQETLTITYTNSTKDVLVSVARA